MTADDRPAITPGLAAWAAPIDVIADPHQLYAGRVWTGAEDIVQGVGVRDGQEVVAGWEDHTWIAEVSWDPEELGWLWLHPVRFCPLPDAEQVHAGSSREDVLADLVAAAALLVELVHHGRALARRVLADLGPAADELPEATVTLLLRAARQPRRWPSPDQLGLFD